MANHMIRARSRRRALAAYTAVAALGLAACGGSSDGEAVAGPPEVVDEASWEEVLSGAKEEGELVVYASLNPFDHVVDAFEEKYPEISVTVERAPTSDLVSRLDQELEVDAEGADVAMHSQAAWFDERDGEEQFAPITVSPEQAEAGSEERLDGKGYTSVFTIAYVLGYNTESGEKVTSMGDFLETATGQRVGVPEANITPAQTFLYSQWQDEYGSDFLKDLAADTTATEYGSNVPLAQGLASGEIDYGVGVDPSSIQNLKDEGAPVDFAVPEEANSGVPQTAAALANAQHPDAAQLFLDFLVSEEGAEVFAEHHGPASTPVKVQGSIPWGDLPSFAAEGWTEEDHLAFVEEQYEPAFG